MNNRILLHVWGPWACFTRPEMKVERVSYDVMTPSAARGILEAIYWKPQIRWGIDRIHVLNPIRFTNIRRNEVASKINARTVSTVMNLGTGNLGLVVEDDRQQRAGTILRDVAYVIEARFDVIGGTDPPRKHAEMFKRRAVRGQCFHRPYLGCREFNAEFAWVEEGHLPPCGLPDAARNQQLGYMLHDIDFANGMTPRFFPAHLRDGVVDVPAFEAEEVRA